ncbi:MAG: hypothetical protein QGD90_08780 [Candidatus Hydrogenedentes bacterium]|nr:hypothetical protein [Candidatus Hydrogenedentota bacterium]
MLPKESSIRLACRFIARKSTINDTCLTRVISRLSKCQLRSYLSAQAELEDLKAEQRPSSVDFNEYYRYPLSKREHGQWHHCNPEMQRWRQGQIIERVGDEALAAGYDSWLVFDLDEGLLARAVTGERV